MYSGCEAKNSQKSELNRCSKQEPKLQERRHERKFQFKMWYENSGELFLSLNVKSEKHHSLHFELALKWLFKKSGGYFTYLGVFHFRTG